MLRKEAINAGNVVLGHTMLAGTNLKVLYPMTLCDGRGLGVTGLLAAGQV
jgi:hypothetical protein